MLDGIDPDDLEAILFGIGAEISRPLLSLRLSLGRIADEPEGTLPARQRAHASTMITLCDELDGLTRQTFGSVEPA